MSLKGDLIAVGIGGAVLLLAAWYAKHKLKAAADAVADAVAPVIPYVNPADERNVVNQAAEGIYHAVTGSNGSPGADFYDATHGGMLSNGTFNPTSSNNLINRGFDSLYQGVTGSTSTLGSDLYDWFH